MRVTAVINGSAALLDPFEQPLETRISVQLSEWYQVLDVQIVRQYDLLSFYYDYQATIAADTKTGPADPASVAEKMKLAVYLATGILPSAVAVTSAGQPAPLPPAPGVLDSASTLPKAIVDLVGSVANGLGVTLETAKVLIVTIGVAGVFVLVWIARNPTRARSLV